MTLQDATRSWSAGYATAWCNLQKRERLVSWIALSYVPCMAALIIVIIVTGERVVPQLFLYAAALWLVAHAAASWYRQEFRCPRCMHRFFPRGHDACRCVSCGLPLWSNGNGDAFEAPARTPTP